MAVKPETRQLVREIYKRLIAVEIPIRWRSGSLIPGPGVRKSTSRGSDGYDVAARVEYEPGDDPRDIDWVATAQTGGQTVLTTQYMEPREIKVFVLADVNPTMDFGTNRVTKRQLAAELAGSVIKSAQETNDKAGFIAYSDHAVEAQMSAAAPQVMLMPALYNLLEAPGNKTGSSSGLAAALSLLPQNRCLVFIISDFLHLTDAEKKAIKRMGYVHDIVCLAVQDRRERELPAPLGWFPELLTIRDIRTGELRTIWLTKKNRKAFADNFKRHQDALMAFFKEAHCDKATFSTEEGEAAIPKVMRVFAGHRS